MGKIWNWIKGAYQWGKNNIVKPIWNGVKGIQQWASGNWRKLDSWLKNASHAGIPVLSELAGVISGNPLYSTIDSIVNESDNIINYGENIGDQLEKIFGSDHPDVNAMKLGANDIMKLISASSGRISNLFGQAGRQAGELVKVGGSVSGMVIPNKPAEQISGSGQLTSGTPSTTTPTVNNTAGMTTRPVQLVAG